MVIPETHTATVTASRHSRAGPLETPSASGLKPRGADCFPPLRRDL